MKKILLASILSVVSVSVAQACEITPSMKIQMCAEILTLKDGQTAEVVMPGIPSADFQIKPVLNHALRITYTGKITENKQGELLIKDSEGNVVNKKPMSLSTKDYAEGYEKVKKGFGELMNDLRGK